MAEEPAKEDRKPWVVPAAVGAVEPEDIANSYQLHQDSNPHASNNSS
jgi:hypothetical protein